MALKGFCFAESSRVVDSKREINEVGLCLTLSFYVGILIVNLHIDFIDNPIIKNVTYNIAVFFFFFLFKFNRMQKKNNNIKVYLFFLMPSNARRVAPVRCSSYASRKILALPKRRES